MTITSIHTYPRTGLAAPKQLVIMLHGYGADGEDLLGLAPYLAANWPDGLFVSPDAPDACEINPVGRQWFSLADWTPAKVLAGAQTAMPVLNSFIDEQLNKYRLHPKQCILLGFSQGAMLALYTALRRTPPIGGVISFAGMLLDAENTPTQIRSNIPVLLVHGTADQVVPFHAMQQAETYLGISNVPYNAHAIDGLGHGIDPEGLSAAQEFLQEVWSK